MGEWDGLRERVEAASGFVLARFRGGGGSNQRPGGEVGEATSGHASDERVKGEGRGASNSI